MSKHTTKELIGLIIKNAREKNSLTQEELSARININQSNLSNIENGKNFPSFQTLCALIEILNIQPNDLFSFLKFKGKTKDLLDVTIEQYISGFSDDLKLNLIEIIKRMK